MNLLHKTVFHIAIYHDCVMLVISDNVNIGVVLFQLLYLSLKSLPHPVHTYAHVLKLGETKTLLLFSNCDLGSRKCEECCYSTPCCGVRSTSQRPDTQPTLMNV